MNALFLFTTQSMMRPKPAISRNLAIALAVVLLHIGFIWGLYSGLLMRAVELVVPVVVLSQFIDPPAPKIKTPPPPPPPPAQVKKASTAPSVAAPQPLAIADPTPSPIAPSGVTTPQPAPAPVTAPVAAVPAAAPPASLAVQLPSSNADYLQNPRPPYPPLSRRLNEQGKSMVRVLIGADGQPQRAEIANSSGFARLDEAALATVMRWRYVPGKRGGVAETMWFNVPINWVLE
jgi:protein TonB